MDGTVRYPFRYCASARCAFFTGRATEVQRRTSMHVRRYPVRPGRRESVVLARSAKEWIEEGCDGRCRCRDGRRSWLPRPTTVRISRLGWLVGCWTQLMKQANPCELDRHRQPHPRSTQIRIRTKRVDSTLFVDSELDDKGQSVAVGRPRRALLFARPLLFTYPASIVGSLAMARTSRMHVGASAALCRRKLGG